MANATQLTQLDLILGKLFDSQREEWKVELSPEEFERRRHDFVFHMTDPKQDLQQFAALCSKLDLQDEETTSSFLIGFLYHVVPHLNAAARLLLGEIEDPFSPSRLEGANAAPNRDSQAKAR